MTICNFDILLSQNWASPFFHVRFQLLLLDLHTGFTGGSKVAWYSYLLKNFPKFVVIHTVKSFSIVYEVKVDIFWNSLAFPIIQWMSAIWSLVPLPFLNLASTSESSWFMYYWSLAWRIFSNTEDPGGLQSMGSQRVRHKWTTSTFPFFSFHTSNINLLILPQ